MLRCIRLLTRIWHRFEINTLTSDDTTIDAILDISEALTSAEDFTRVNVRFLVSRNDGGEKAESRSGQSASGSPCR